VTIGGRPTPATLKNADFTLVSGTNPCKSVIYSIASPAFPGLYQVAVTVPAGTGGPSPLVPRQGAAASNTVLPMVR